MTSMRPAASCTIQHVAAKSKVKALPGRPAPPQVQFWLDLIQDILPDQEFADWHWRFAFLLPADAPVPPMMNQSAAGENFLTRGFNSAEQAMAWLTATRLAEEGR